MRKLDHGIYSVLLASVFALVACGKNSSDTGTAKLQFTNSQNSSVSYFDFLNRFLVQKSFAATMSTPTEFKMKLVAAYLAADIDPKTENNVGASAPFYVNPECLGDLKHCDVSGGAAEDGADLSHVIQTFFDFGQSSDVVNRELNAQGLSIPVGQYKYVRLEFCKYNHQGVPNVAWQGGTNNSETLFVKNECDVHSVEMNPPLVIQKGESAVVKLTYDYSASIQVGADAQGDHCSGSGDSTSCFTVPNFIPSVSK